MGDDFLLSYLPFWIVTYVLALAGWVCIGRFMMQFVVAPDSTNYIWRSFRALSAVPMAVARLMVPSYVHGLFLPLVAASGLAPRIAPPAGG